MAGMARSGIRPDKPAATFRREGAHRSAGLGRTDTVCSERRFKKKKIIIAPGKKGTYAFVFFGDLHEAEFEHAFEEPCPSANYYSE